MKQKVFDLIKSSFRYNDQVEYHLIHTIGDQDHLSFEYNLELLMDRVTQMIVDKCQDDLEYQMCQYKSKLSELIDSFEPNGIMCL